MLLRFTPKVEHVKCVVLTPVEGSRIERTIVQLLPGVNEVTDSEWNCMKPNIAGEIARGEVTILAQKVSDGRGKPGGRKAKDLVEMPVNIAVTYVNECTSGETLVKWYLEETREEVRLSITKRMEKLGVDKPEDRIPDAPNASPMSLEEFEAEDEAEAGAGEEEADVDDKIDLKTLPKAELVEKARELGIAGAADMKKDELVAAIEAEAGKEEEN